MKKSRAYEYARDFFMAWSRNSEFVDGGSGSGGSGEDAREDGASAIYFFQNTFDQSMRSVDWATGT